MGYGDWLHWTSVIRDVILNINNKKTNNDKIKYINRLIENFNKFKLYGVKNYVNRDDISPYKIYINNLKILKHQDEIFLNSPYITYDESYPNYIDFVFVTQDYWKSYELKFKDDIHAVETYCRNIGLTNYNIKAEMFFTSKEKKRIKKIIPKKDFILIQPCDYKSYGKYPFNKFQEIVNKLKDKITFYQIGPEKVKKKRKFVETKLLNNVKSFIGKTSTFREGVLLMKHAKLCLVVE